MAKKPTYYEILNVSRDASEIEFREAYREAVKPCQALLISGAKKVNAAIKAIAQAWQSLRFEAFRGHLRGACPDCESRSLCFGGCPIAPDIVPCDKKLRICFVIPTESNARCNR